MKQNLLFNRARALSKRLAMVLTMLLIVGIGQVWGATDVILWNGSNPSYQASTTEKTSTDGAITWVNSAGNTYSNPTRIYSGNTLTISVANTTTTQITKIVAVCTSSDYASAFGGTSVDVTGGGTANRSVSGSTTTITITGKATAVAMKMSAQSRVSKLTVTYVTAAATKYTVTLKDDNSTLTQSSAGESVTLPSREGCDGYEFVGWTKSWSVAQTTWTTTAPTIIPDGGYTPTANVNLYPVYTKIETTEGTTKTTDYVLTDLANIKSTDVVVITSKNSSDTYYAMSNNNGTGTAPTATSVTVSNSKLSSKPNDNLKWNISNSSGNLTIYPNGTTATWLYCTSTNNGVRVGTNANKTFTIDSSTGYLKHASTSRYLGVYNNQDWRCYTSTTVNIANQTFHFFVETTTTSTTTTYYISVPDCTTETAVYLIPKNSNFWMAHLRLIFGASSAASVALP